MAICAKVQKVLEMKEKWRFIGIGEGEGKEAKSRSRRFTFSPEDNSGMFISNLLFSIRRSGILEENLIMTCRQQNPIEMA